MVIERLKDKSFFRQALQLTVLTSIFGIVLWVTRTYLNIGGVDWYYHFYPDTLDWLQGKSFLYDEATTGFYHPPWGILFFVPFVWMGYEYGLAGIRVATVAMLIFGALVFTASRREHIWGVVLALFNLHTFDLLFRAQMSGLDVLGAGIGWLAITGTNPWLMGISYTLLSISPPNTLPFALVMAWWTWARWDREQFFQSLIIPVCVGILSFFIFGLWPIRWVDNWITRPPGESPGSPWFTTIWWAAHILDISWIVPASLAVFTCIGFVIFWSQIQRCNMDEHQRLLLFLMFSTATFFVVTPWALSYRYALLYAMVVPYLLRWKLGIVLGLHMLTYLPVARLVVGVRNAWIDVAYPIAIFLILIFYIMTLRAEAQKAATPPQILSQDHK